MSEENKPLSVNPEISPEPVQPPASGSEGSQPVKPSPATVQDNAAASEKKEDAPVASSTPSSAPAAPPTTVPKPAAAPPPPPPEPRVFGRLLLDQSLPFTPLGADARGIELIEVAASDWLTVAETLKSGSAFEFDLLVSVSAVDWKTHRQAVYHLYSTTTYTWLGVKVSAQVETSATGESVDVIPSVYDIWNAADWHEREAYDLMGLHFQGHPNLSRILMPNDWVGYPLRKDYKENDPRLVWNRR